MQTQQRVQDRRLSTVAVPEDHSTEQAYRRAVGSRLRTVRALLDLDQQEVADAAGISRNFVSAIERAAQGLDAFRLSLIAQALDMPLTTLLEGTDFDTWVRETSLPRRAAD